MQKVDVTKIVQPGIEIFGVLLMEPVTVITNLLISGMCFYAFLVHAKRELQKQYFSFFEVLLCGHGYSYHMGWVYRSWILVRI